MIKEDLLSKLTSAYQEEAIETTLKNIKEYRYPQDFAYDCCLTYREILKKLGGDIYRLFRKYGDETEVHSIAVKIYNLVVKA